MVGDGSTVLRGETAVPIGHISGVARKQWNKEFWKLRKCCKLVKDIAGAKLTHGEHGVRTERA